MLLLPRGAPHRRYRERRRRRPSSWLRVKVTAVALDALRPVQGVLQSIGATVLQPATYPPGADIEAMSEAGVPAFGVMQDGRTHFNYHHPAADTQIK